MHRTLLESIREKRSWRTAVWIVLAVLTVAWINTATITAKAQDGARPAAEGNKAAAEDGEPGAAASPRRTSTLEWLIRTSGWIGAVLLCLSIYFVAKVVSLFMEMRPEVAMPPVTHDQYEELLKSKDFMTIYKMAKQDDSFYSKVLATGLAELPQGLTASRDAMERVGDTLIVDMEKNISMLAVLGSLGPMIGLLGTLKGMIGAFGAIATSGTQLKASDVAGHISEALVLTFEGVGLSVPAIYFYALFRNRVASISTATMLAADDFIRRAIVASRTKAPPKPAATNVE